MSGLWSQSLDETTAIDRRYALRVERGMTLSLFDFPDIQLPEKTVSIQPVDLEQQHKPAQIDRACQTGTSLPTTRPVQTLLTLPPEIRERIYRFVLNNIDNAPEAVRCRYCYPRSRLELRAQPSKEPRLCFGLQSSVKSGKFPNLLVLNRQTYFETTKLLYSGRSFVFCTWHCFSGWAEKLLQRDRTGSEELLIRLGEVIIHLDMQNGYRTSGHTARSWATAVEDSIKQMFGSSTKVAVEVVKPTSDNQLVVMEARLTFSKGDGRHQDEVMEDKWDLSEFRVLDPIHIQQQQ